MLKKIKKHKIIAAIVCGISMLALLASIGYGMWASNSKIKAEEKNTEPKAVQPLASGPMGPSFDWIYDNIAKQPAYGQANFPAPVYGQLSLIKFSKISQGHLGSTALDATGHVWTWGSNERGQLGIGKRYSFVGQNGGIGAGGGMQRVLGIDNIVDVEAGYYFNIAVNKNGDVYTWGNNSYEQNARTGGDSGVTSGFTTPQLLDRAAVGMGKVKKIATSFSDVEPNFAVALDENNDIWVWGQNAAGQHGVGTTTNTASYRATPHKAQMPADAGKVVDIEAGGFSVYALMEDGSIYSWGRNSYGELGNGRQNTANQTTPQKMELPDEMGKVVQISALYTSAVVMDENHKVWQWGNYATSWDTKGTAASYSYKWAPTEVKIKQSEIEEVGYTPIPQSINAGEWTSNFIDQYGRIWAWGGNIYYGLGTVESPYLTPGGRGYPERYAVFEPEAIQSPKIVGDGDTNANGTLTPRPQGQGNYGYDALHPTVFDEKYHQNGKSEQWTKFALSPFPYTVSISSGRSGATAVDAAGNIWKWSYDGSGTVAWGWDTDDVFDYNYSWGGPATQKLNGLYNKYTYEPLFLRGSPNVDYISIDLGKPTKKIYKSTNETDEVTAKFTLPAGHYDEQLNFNIAAELREAKYLIVPYDEANADFSSQQLSYAEFMELYNNSSYEKGDLIDAPIFSEDNILTVEKKIKVTDNSKVWVMYEDVAGEGMRVVQTVQSYTADNFYTDTTVNHQGFHHEDKKTEVYDKNGENIEKVTQDGIDKLIGFPLDAKGNIIGTSSAPPTFGYDEVKVSKLTPEQLADIDPNLHKYWLWHTPQADSKTFILNGVDAANEDDITKSSGELAVTDSYTHKFYYDENPDAFVNLQYIGVDKKGNRIPEFNMTPNPEKLKKEVEYLRTPPTLSAEAGYTAISYKVVYTVPPADPVDISGSTSLETNGDVKFTIPWGNEIKNATVIIIYDQAPLAHFISADRGVNPYTAVTGFVNEDIRTPKGTDYTHEPNDSAINSEYALVGYKIFDKKLTDVSGLDLTTDVIKLANGKAVYMPPADQEEYTVVYIYEKAPLVHYKAAVVGDSPNNVLADFSMASERLTKDEEQVKTPVYNNDNYVAIGYKIIDNKVADDTLNLDITGYIVSKDGTAAFIPQDHGYEFTVVFVYEKKTIVNFVGINGQDETNLIFMDNWDLSAKMVVKGSNLSQTPKDYTVPDGFKVTGYYVVNGKITDPTTVDLAKAKALVNGSAEVKVPTDQDEITVIFIYEIPPAFGIVHVRQVIVDGNSKVAAPKNGYMVLKEAKVGSNWIYGTQQKNISTISGLDTKAVSYSDYELPISKEYMGYGLKWTTPQYYSYLGYKISSENGNYDSSGMKTSKEIQMDFTSKNEYWVTVYLTPFTDKPGNFSWADAINKFGELLVK
jgi:alpha-tubulin suppressor-like RCC1 family protein